MEQEGRRDHAALICDTNVIVRLLTNRPESQAGAAARVLDSTERIWLTDAVVAEVCYVMTTVAGAPRVEVAERLAQVIALGSIVVADEDVLLDALQIWGATSVGFIDAYVAALARSAEDAAVLSFDRDLDRIEGVKRIDPARY